MHIQSCDALVLNVPEFFENKEFIAWLESPNVMTTHRAGEVVGEFTEAMVFIDPGMSGEGSDQFSMPDEIWDAIFQACKERIPVKSFVNHIMVRLINVEA